MAQNEIKDKRLHKLLSYILKESLEHQGFVTKFTWRIEDVRKDLKLERNELKYLLRLLWKDDIVTYNDTIIEFSDKSGYHNAHTAYYSKQYLPETNFWNVPINISLILGGFATLGTLFFYLYSNQQSDTIKELKKEKSDLLIRIDSLLMINQSVNIDSLNVD